MTPNEKTDSEKLEEARGSIFYFSFSFPADGLL